MIRPRVSSFLHLFCSSGDMFHDCRLPEKYMILFMYLQFILKKKKKKEQYLKLTVHGCFLHHVKNSNRSPPINYSRSIRILLAFYGFILTQYVVTQVSFLLQIMCKKTELRGIQILMHWGRGVTNSPLINKRELFLHITHIHTYFKTHHGYIQ